jgi:hypothetical protein
VAILSYARAFSFMAQESRSVWTGHLINLLPTLQKWSYNTMPLTGRREMRNNGFRTNCCMHCLLMWICICYLYNIYLLKPVHKKETLFFLAASHSAFFCNFWTGADLGLTKSFLLLMHLHSKSTANMTWAKRVIMDITNTCCWSLKVGERDKNDIVLDRVFKNCK